MNTTQAADRRALLAAIVCNGLAPHHRSVGEETPQAAARRLAQEAVLLADQLLLVLAEKPPHRPKKEPVRTSAPSPEQARVVEALEAAGRPLTVAEIAQRVQSSATYSALARMVSRLAARGLIRREYRGHYSALRLSGP